MQQINVHEAKTHLSKLLDRVENGEEIVISRAGKPVAKLVPYWPQTGPRIPGAWKGRGWIGDDFEDELPEEIASAFRGEAP
jgi:prevent-host-death family protein